MGFRDWIDRERTPQDWAWIIFGWIAFSLLIAVVVILVSKFADWWYSI